MRYAVDEIRANLALAVKEGLVGYGGETCPVCGSNDFIPSANQKPAHCNSCQTDRIAYQESIGYKEVDCCCNCVSWQPHVYAGHFQGYHHCQIAQEKGVNWSATAPFGWCSEHQRKVV